MFSTAAAARRFDRAAARGRADEAYEVRDELFRAYLNLTLALSALKDEGVDGDAIQEAAGLLHTAITNRDGECRQAIDEAGEYVPDWLDLTELRELCK